MKLSIRYVPFIYISQSNLLFQMYFLIYVFIHSYVNDKNYLINTYIFMSSHHFDVQDHKCQDNSWQFHVMEDKNIIMV